MTTYPPRVQPALQYKLTEEYVTDGTGKRWRVIKMVRDMNYESNPMPDFKHFNKSVYKL